MPLISFDGQFVPAEPFVAPVPISAGNDEERYARHRARFAGLPFNLKEHNALQGWVEFKRWHHRAMKEREHD